jgi:hypothetical protein
MMSADQAGTWNATAFARDEATIRTAALSVRQRKLLALLNTPMSIDSLSSMSGIPHAEVETTLQRFEKLGLVAASAAGAAPAAFRPATFNESTGGSNKLAPIVVGGVALTAVAAAIWWFMQSGSSTPSTPTTAQTAAAGTTKAPATPALSAPGDGSTTSVFVGNPLAQIPDSSKQAAKDAQTKETARETQAREAAKAVANAKTTPAPAPAATAATTPPAPAPAPAAAAATPPPPPPAPAAAPAPAPTAAPAVQVPVRPHLRRHRVQPPVKAL